MNERYGKGGLTCVEKALGVGVVVAVGFLLFELALGGYWRNDLQVFAGNVAVAVNQILDYGEFGVLFVRGDVQLPEGVGLVELFAGMSKKMPDISIDQGVARAIQQPFKSIFE